MEKSATEVLIIGAGPSGLTMGCELMRHGIACRIIEKHTQRSNLSRALGIHARSLEIFEDMKIIEPFLEEGIKISFANIYNHNLRPMVKVNMQRIQSHYPFVLDLPQNRTEQILQDHFERLGGTIDFGMELVSFEQNEQQVISQIKNEKDEPQQITSDWLVGCDGAHSTVRHLLGIDFVGNQSERRWIFADVDVDWSLPYDELNIIFNRNGVLASFPLHGNHLRILADVTRERERNFLDPTLEDFQKYMQQRGPAAATLKNPTWITSFDIHYRMAEKFQVNRAFLVGDAAHIHSPAGAQGMNTGIQDAYNLAWKLAFVKKNKARRKLLDSYSEERYQTTKSVMALSHGITTASGLHNPIACKIRNTFMSIFPKLKPIHDKIVHRMSQLSLHYQGCSMIKNRCSPKLKHLRGGMRMPDAVLQDTQGNLLRLHQIIAGTQYHLLWFCGINSNTAVIDQLQSLLQAIKAFDTIHVDIICGDSFTDDRQLTNSIFIDQNYALHNKFAIQQPIICLVRPDNYVGFLNQPANEAQLLKYLDKIFF